MDGHIRNHDTKIHSKENELNALTLKSKNWRKKLPHYTTRD